MRVTPVATVTSATRAGRIVLVAATLATAVVAAAPSRASTSWVRPAGVVDPGLSQVGGGLRSVVVSGWAGAAALVHRAAEAVGGTQVRELPIVDGVSVTVPADRIAELAHAPGVRAVTANRAVQVQGSSWDDSTSASAYAWNAGAAQTWATTGRGSSQVSVAVLDTGVSQVGDLAGRVLHGPDLSGENRNDVDSYGHGTVMAGIIAGTGADAGAAPRTGVAPGVNIISVKVAGANGASDVSTVLAGLSWIGAFQDVYAIKVLNLSWGVSSTQDPRVDPLNYAVERLWTSGVTVVVAAGNSGPSAGSVLKPADDPLVLTVGAYDDKADSVLTNDSVPAWSSQGPTAAGLAKPDVVAPGRTLIATRAPGSTVERDNPRSLVGGAYIKGSGTSEATAVVSGVAALLLSAHPTWTPDQVKLALTSTASPIAGATRLQQGAGRVSARAAMVADVSAATTSTVLSNAMGTLEGSRGTSPHVSTTCAGATKVLDDETTSWCGQWTGTAWTGTAWTGTAWTGTAWTGTAWTGTAWTGTAWTGTAWTGTAWTSAEYDVEEPTSFMSAFWGKQPGKGRYLPGETSEGTPARGCDCT